MGDLFVPLLVCFIFFSLIAYCFKRKRERFISAFRSPGVTVTTTHVASPVVNPPYPIDARHPIPVPPQIGFTEVPVSTVGIASNNPTSGVYPHHHTTHHTAPNITPYIPTITSMPPYLPTTSDGYLSTSIAPVANTRASAPRSDSSQPPSYYEATGQIAAPHQKQSPYNPHF